MGGGSTLASAEPRVLYVGSDAEGVAAAWNDGERAFALVPVTLEDARETFADGHIDCVVCHSDGDGDATTVLEGIRNANDSVPIVVLSTGDGVRADRAMAIGATYVDLDADFDPIRRLADVGPIVERHRDAVRDRTMLDSLLAHIPLSVYWKDGQSRHVRVSDAMLTMIGPDYMENPEGKRFHAPADVEGNSDWDLYPAELAENATSDDQSVMETEEPIVDRVEHSYGSPADGTYVATSKAPWYDEQGNVVGMVGVTRDISERMQYEHQLERQNERLERFARVISHDLRNPLEVARGRLDLAEEGDDPAAHFGPMRRALDRMDDLIDDVLTLAREGEVVADPETVDLSTAATAAWDVVDSGDVSLAVETEAEILADPGGLQQIFENLFRNAVQHGREEGDPLTITVDVLPYHGFFVEDDGGGIPADVREEIFEPGFSAGDSGTGLGLGIVRTIAEAHGWEIEVGESDAGGARFEFWNVRRVPSGGE